MVLRPHAVFGFFLALGWAAAWPLSAAEPAPASRPQSATLAAQAMAQALAPAMDGMAKGISQHYQLDAEQSRTAQELVRQFFHTLIENHAEELGKLQMEITTTLQITEKTPTAEQVQNWAERFAPIFEDFKAELQKSNDALHECLNDEQKKQHDADLAKFQQGLTEFDGKLARWRRGEYKPEDGFFAIPANRGVPAHEPERSWYFYTQKFIRDYELDPAQTTSANSILKELSDRAEQMRASRAAELKPLDDQMAALTAAAPPDTAALQKALAHREALMKPITGLFDELKTRLDKLPRDVQRTKFDQQRNPPGADSHRTAATQAAPSRPEDSAPPPAHEPTK